MNETQCSFIVSKHKSFTLSKTNKDDDAIDINEKKKSENINERQLNVKTIKKAYFS